MLLCFIAFPLRFHGNTTVWDSEGNRHLFLSVSLSSLVPFPTPHQTLRTRPGRRDRHRENAFTGHIPGEKHFFLEMRTLSYLKKRTPDDLVLDAGGENMTRSHKTARCGQARRGSAFWALRSQPAFEGRRRRARKRHRDSAAGTASPEPPGRSRLSHVHVRRAVLQTGPVRRAVFSL